MHRTNWPWSLSFLAMACGSWAPPEPGPEERPTSGIGSTTSEATADTATPQDTADTGVESTEGTGDTGTAPLECTVTTQSLLGGQLFGAWMSPTGQTYAVGPSGGSVRDILGSWTDDPLIPAMRYAQWIHGVDDDNVWAASRDGVGQRDASGVWTDRAFPGAPHQIVGLRVLGVDHVLVVTADDDPYGTQSDVGLYTWDGAAWSSTLSTVPAAVASATVLPDGRVVLGGRNGLMVQAGALWTPIPIPTLDTEQVLVGADGTLVALGAGVSVGDATGLTLQDLGSISVYGWTGGWVGGVDDIWLVGLQLDGGYYTGAAVVHWDGAAWAKVAIPQTDLMYDIASNGAGDLVAVGGTDGRTALVGDSGGFMVELDTVSIGSLSDIAVDDVTGIAHGVGTNSRATFDGSAWQPVATDELELGFASQVAVTDDRVLVGEYDTLQVLEGGTVTTTPIANTESLFTLLGSQGTLFALGDLYIYDGPQIGAAGYRNDGVSWQPLDVSGLPEGAGIRAAWADAPDDVWLGLDNDDDGGLAHYDGTTMTLVTPLPGVPFWLARQSDGLLWMNLSQGPGSADPLRTWDGTTLAVVSGAPASVGAAHRFSDGTVYTSSVAPDPNGEGYVGILSERDPNGVWSEVLSTDGIINLVGRDDELWVVIDRESAWTRSCSP